MIVDRIAIDCSKILDWPSFHSEFATAFGFPEFYGKNMNAWIDCMTSLDAPEDGMSAFHCLRGSVMTLELQNVERFKEQFPHLYSTVIEYSAFVNYRRLKLGEPAVIVFSFNV
jgi:hypothetical protein